MLRTSYIISIFLIISPYISNCAEYYWVGGSGNWSDISHWKTSSGGNVGHAQAPTPNDNVIFDANSFTGPNQMVTFNTDIIFCQNFDWSGVTNSPRIEGGRNVTFMIYGDINLPSNMDFSFDGSLILTGNQEDKQINFGPHTAGFDMSVDGAGSWNLQSNLEVDSLISILQGGLNLGNNTVETEYIRITGTGQKRLDLGESTITLTGISEDIIQRNDYDDPKNLLIETDNLMVTPGNSTIEFTSKDATFWYLGDGELQLNNLVFSANTGQAILHNRWHLPQVSINNLSFSSSAVIDKVDRIETLQLNGGNVYEFESFETFDIGEILGIGDCARGIIMTSSENSVETTINVNSGNVNIDYLTLRDVHATGGASFDANFGVDLGNNSGWSFSGTNSIDFYWVGGTGDWTDPQHWSLTSGGPSSGCIPSGKDDVYFDANSFSGGSQTVTVDRENIYAHNIVWAGVTGNPVLAGDEDHRFRITGSLELSADMVHDFAGSYNFESNESGNTIRSNGIILNQDVVFSMITNHQ